jgi:hypothetical protein
MNAAAFRKRIKLVAEWAKEQEPTDIDARARIFIAGLSGRIEADEPALSAIIWAVLHPYDAPFATSTAASAE